MTIDLQIAELIKNTDLSTADQDRCWKAVKVCSPETMMTLFSYLSSLSTSDATIFWKLILNKSEKFFSGETISGAWIEKELILLSKFNH